MSTGTIFLRFGNDILATASVSNLQIKDNSLFNCGGNGVLIGKNSRSAWATAVAAQICRNEIVQQNTVGVLADFTFYSVVKDLSIDDNSVVLTNPGKAGAASDDGIMVLGPAVGTVTSVSVQRNTLDNVSGNVAATAAINLAFPDDIQQLQMIGNMVSTTAVGGAVFLNADAISDVLIEGNQTRNTQRNAIAVGMISSILLRIEKNIIDSVVSASSNGIEIAMGPGSISALGTSIVNNSTFNCIGDGINLSFDCNIYGLAIEGNLIDANSVGANGIRVLGYGQFDRVSVSSNKVAYTTGSGIEVQNNGNPGGFVRNLAICNNIIQFGYEPSATDSFGIMFWAVRTGSGTYDSSISENQVMLIDIPDPGIFRYGIWVRSSHADCPFQRHTCLGNIVTMLSNETMMRYDIAENTAGSISNMVFANNLLKFGDLTSAWGVSPDKCIALGNTSEAPGGNNWTSFATGAVPPWINFVFANNMNDG
jgi:hypothetical protein